MGNVVKLVAVVALVVGCGGQSPADTLAPQPTPVRTTATTSEPSRAPTAGPTATLAPRWSVPTAGEGWSTRADFAHVTAMVHEDQTNLTIATELSGAGGTPLQPGADALVAYLESIDDLEVSAREAVEVDGNPAIQVEIRATADIPELFHIGPVDGNGGYVLSDGQRAQIWALDPGDPTVVIIVEPGAGKNLQPSVRTAQPVIDSIVFE
jgi:hypothetical protein